MGRDRYPDFAELARRELIDRDWWLRIVERDSPLLILAPHGGGIEPGTSEIAREIAGEDLSLYCFEGIRARGNDRLHITSTRFDEPACLQLLARSRIAVTIHGCANREPIVLVGGRHGELRVRVERALTGAGFTAREENGRHSGDDPANICNRAAAAMGLQLEISRGLRRALFPGLRRHERRQANPALARFATTVRLALRDALAVRLPDAPERNYGAPRQSPSSLIRTSRCPSACGIIKRGCPQPPAPIHVRRVSLPSPTRRMHGHQACLASHLDWGRHRCRPPVMAPVAGASLLPLPPDATSSAPRVEVLAGTGDRVRLSLELPALDIESIDILGETYQAVQFERGEWVGEYGRPGAARVHAL